ncbi:hypothetical protein [Rhizobium sp. CCGE 510]|uniref:hypothetical protein n=1 Tax=Rhizobium sp. CCGE 510 TaxID=1132836 RepID=UPI0012F6E82C|nr:hypothetical protein [Rhizobium sp. CCGE 510]
MQSLSWAIALSLVIQSEAVAGSLPSILECSTLGEACHDTATCKTSDLGKKFTLDFTRNAVSSSTFEDQITSTTFVEGEKLQLSAVTQSDKLIFLAAKNMKAPDTLVWTGSMFADAPGDTQLTGALILCRPPTSTAIRG